MTAYGREGEAFELAAVGDAILTRRLSRMDYPGLAPLRERLRGADAGFANLEVLVHDYEHPRAAESGGTYMRAPPGVLDDLAWLGVDVLAAANNHTADYGVGGMEATMAALDDRDATYAGLGEHLAAARAPAYRDTPAGRVALVACCSTVVGGATAGEQTADLPGRPGLAPLRLDSRYVVPEDARDRVRTLAERLGLGPNRERFRELGFPVPGEDEPGDTFPAVGGEDLRFVTEGDLDSDEGDEAGGADGSDGDDGDVDDAPGAEASPHADVEGVAGEDPEDPFWGPPAAEEGYRVERTVRSGDADPLLERVRTARRQADWVLVSVHSHEGVGPRHNDATVPAFVRRFARRAVDAGADAVLGHGSHVLKGVELYDGAPLLYGLGDFAMGNETVGRLPPELYARYDLDPSASPADLFDARTFEDGDPDGERAGFLASREFYESVVACPRWAGGELAELELVPVELGFDAPRPQRGRPRLADERAEAILERVAERSAPFGVDVRVEDGVGVVDVDVEG